MDFKFRKAKVSDVDDLESLISLSAKSINSAYYSKREVDAALGNVWGVDLQLISDNTYWVVENLEGLLVGCGGWSKRKLLFGKNDILEASDNELMPGIDSARIRAFFVHPDFTRMGIGKKILEICENEAILSGFDSLELVSTLSGVKLYSSSGYLPQEYYELDLGNGITNKVVSMYKSLK